MKQTTEELRRILAVLTELHDTFQQLIERADRDEHRDPLARDDMKAAWAELHNRTSLLAKRGTIDGSARAMTAAESAWFHLPLSKTAAQPRYRANSKPEGWSEHLFSVGSDLDFARASLARYLEQV